MTPENAAPRNASAALATTVLDGLVREGLRHVVLAPGSRSAPLAFAGHRAALDGRLTLHTRIDERSAGFLALGLAVTSRSPVAVVTTSGTAVANLHPAVLEASHRGVPLVVLTADRPAHLRGTQANQTTDQVRIFGTATRLDADVEPGDGSAPPEAQAAQVERWRDVVRRAVAATRGEGIADLPLDRYLGPCQVVKVPPMPLIEPRHVDGIDLANPGRILFKTESVRDRRVFPERFTALSPELAALLAEKRALLVGMDTPSVDPFDSKTLDAHHALFRGGVLILEGLVLDGVPEGTYELIALPLKMAGLDASPVRAVLRTLEA